jgi:transitional endoplasmic reticulum ATPase
VHRQRRSEASESSDGGVTDRVVAQLLTELDGVSSRGTVTVVAVTSRPQDVDPALLRPGRIDRRVTIGAPDESDRLAILRVHTRAMPLTDEARAQLPALAALTGGLTGADLNALCREAAVRALREDPEASVVHRRHIPLVGGHDSQALAREDDDEEEEEDGDEGG